MFRLHSTPSLMVGYSPARNNSRTLPTESLDSISAASYSSSVRFANEAWVQMSSTRTFFYFAFTYRFFFTEEGGLAKCGHKVLIT